MEAKLTGQLKTRIITIIGVIVIAFAGWRVMTLGISGHYLDMVKKGDVTALDKALLWDSQNPEARMAKAMAMVRAGDPRGISMLEEALDLNPADTRALIALASARLKEGKVEQSDRLIAISLALAPMSSQVALSVGDFLFSRGRPGDAIRQWGRAITIDEDLAAEVYPKLAVLAEDPELRNYFTETVANPPSWWNGFFSEFVKKSEQMDAVFSLVSMRYSSAVPLTKFERSVLTKKLIGEGQWVEAYLVWVNGLDDLQRQHLGNVYNGDFTLPIANNGFGWRLQKWSNGMNWTQIVTEGSDGKALWLEFLGRNSRFSHFSQYLLLQRGDYVLNYRVRTDRLQGDGELRWIFRCIGGDKREFARSDRINTAGKWLERSLEFSVPAEQCAVQELILRSAAGENDQFAVAGSVWFDKMEIRPANKKE